MNGQLENKENEEKRGAKGGHFEVNNAIYCLEYTINHHHASQLCHTSKTWISFLRKTHNTFIKKNTSQHDK